MGEPACGGKGGGREEEEEDEEEGCSVKNQAQLLPGREKVLVSMVQARGAGQGAAIGHVSPVCKGPALLERCQKSTSVCKIFTLECWRLFYTLN